MYGPMKCLLATGVAMILAGCAAPVQQFEVKNIYVCASEECGPAGQRFTAQALTRGLSRLLELNNGLEYKVCESDLRSRHCITPGQGYFVMGGPIPGRGYQKSGRFSNIQVNPTTQTIEYTMQSDLYFIGVPLACVTHPGRVMVKSVDEISLVDDAYFCNWAGIGNMMASFNFAVESIDFDRGRLAGYWAHAVTGNAVGRGQGYGVIELNRGMPREADWFR